MTHNDAFATVPKRIKIGTLVYNVHLVDTMDGELDAQILPDQLIIEIRRSSPDPAYVASSLIHESLHGIWADRNLPESADEETVVSHFERGLCLLIQDNPRLITWVRKCLNAGKKLK